jgi:hypothetical protein
LRGSESISRESSESSIQISDSSSSVSDKHP